jgi:hypothetical protein
MSAFYQVVFVVLLIVATRCEEELHANGPFGKVHLKAEILSLFNCNTTINIFSSSTSVTITDLKVSSTNYSNSETIYVSWTSTSTPCKDDFIGIYFVEIPVETGKKIQLY